MTPTASWLLVLSLCAAGWLCVYALLRAAGRASRNEERIVQSRAEIDRSLELRRQARLAAGHHRVQRGVCELGRVEGPPDEGAA